jgi:hypothetical protein
MLVSMACGKSFCANQSLIFCEDFDELSLGPASSPNFAVDISNGTLTVESANATGSTGSTGNNVLHVHTDGNGRAFLVANVSVPGNSFFGRMNFNVAAFPTAPNFAHYVLVEGHGSDTPEVVRPVGGQFVQTGQDPVGKALYGVGSDLGPTGDWTLFQDSAPSQANVWTCFEWQFNGTDNSVNVFINGQENPDLTVSENKHGGAQNVSFVFPQFNLVKFGWTLFQSGSTPSSFDVLVSDVAMGTSRIGCDCPNMI